ncbi:hypothetical protein [Variovorax sp. OV700]|uniref:hypothetical protein n=1 Tax=Variovorax sp. OV700 TaxID=1882826 RepID=UPI00088B1699|nr:hypothetical protein [Variovorax sp. OV700]SDH55921.1 hypothetical protein SAMN05444748_101697 [Variovorax sp. OV700]
MQDQNPESSSTNHIFGNKEGKKKSRLREVGNPYIQDIQPIWERNLCRGRLHAIVGPADSGKTKTASLIASTVATSPPNDRPWPDGASCYGGLVVICTSSDYETASFELQLRALQTDLRQVRMFSLDEVSLESNLKELEEAINEIAAPVALVVFEGLDRSQSPRRNGMNPGPQLAEFAHRNDCAVLATTTIPESIVKAPNSVVGRLPICGSAAVVFTISNARFSNDQEEGLPSITRIKSTIGPKDESFGFEIVATNAIVEGRYVPAAVARWTGQRTLQSFAQDTSVKGRERRQNQRERAAAFLRVLLGGGAMSSASVIQKCALVQIPEDTARRAATDIGVIRQPQSLGGRRAPDIWSLPGNSATGYLAMAQQAAVAANPGFVAPRPSSYSHFSGYPPSPLWVDLARPLGNSSQQAAQPFERSGASSMGIHIPATPHAPEPAYFTREVAKVAQVGQPWQSAHRQSVPPSSMAGEKKFDGRNTGPNESNAQPGIHSSAPDDMYAELSLFDLVKGHLKKKGD